MSRWSKQKLHDWMQEAFNRSWRGLASQQWERGRAENDECVWAARKDGSVLRCAVGWILDDTRLLELLDSEDGLPVHGDFSDVWDRDVLPSALPKPDNQDDQFELSGFLSELQQAHDQSDALTRDMESNLRELAHSYNLRVPG